MFTRLALPGNRLPARASATRYPVVSAGWAATVKVKRSRHWESATARPSEPLVELKALHANTDQLPLEMIF
jgi:hypothetical protein